MYRLTRALLLLRAGRTDEAAASYRQARHVLVIEDIVDSGLTLSWLLWVWLLWYVLTLLRSNTSRVNIAGSGPDSSAMDR